MLQDQEEIAPEIRDLMHKWLRPWDPDSTCWLEGQVLWVCFWPNVFTDSVLERAPTGWTPVGFRVMYRSPAGEHDWGLEVHIALTKPLRLKLIPD